LQQAAAGVETIMTELHFKRAEEVETDKYLLLADVARFNGSTDPESWIMDSMMADHQRKNVLNAGHHHHRPATSQSQLVIQLGRRPYPPHLPFPS